jgi:hypothetical protein
LQEYEAEAAEFSARLHPTELADLRALREEATNSGFGLLWPTLANILSGTRVETIDHVLVALDRLETDVRPSYEASDYWDAADWSWLAMNAIRIRSVIAALRRADFGAYRNSVARSELDARTATLAVELREFDVISMARKLSGKTLEPDVEITLLYFCRPHGVRVQGQRFLQSPDFNAQTTVRVAAHELLHPPIDMSGPVAQAALQTLQRDPLIPRIVREHDPAWGYTTLEGLLNEDLCQALDQMITERLGMARDPAARWQQVDGGMHVLAAALYGLLRDSGWADRGGNLEEWLDAAIRDGRLAPDVIQATAADVMRRPADELWPPSDV